MLTIVFILVFPDIIGCSFACHFKYWEDCDDPLQTLYSVEVYVYVCLYDFLNTLFSTNFLPYL